MAKNTENSIDKQARVFALVHYQALTHEGLVEKMDQVSRARKWRGAVAKRFRMAVVDAMNSLRMQRARR